MKILYAIQGTGNGHLSRARDVIPALQPYGELDVMISGRQSEVDLPHPPKYYYKGVSFVYNKKGGLSYLKTAQYNLGLTAMREIRSLPVQDYDLIINDFEPISAWAARRAGVTCIGMGHQASFRSPHTPRPTRRDPLGERILRNYAPADHAIGFHFDRYDDFIYTPVIREDIRRLTPSDEGHYTVYLPAFDESVLLGYLQQVPEASWQVFSKFSKIESQQGNVWVRPVSNDAFMESFAGARGILTGAGFETPAEAMYLGKKLFCVPIQGQYEQFCNAAAMEKMGVRILWKIGPDFVANLKQWCQAGTPIQVDYPNHLHEVVAQLFSQIERGVIKLKRTRAADRPA